MAVGSSLAEGVFQSEELWFLKENFFIYNVKVVGVVSFHFSSFLIKLLVSELPTTIPKFDFL